MKKNVAFIGHLMNGKTTSADYLINNYNYTKLAFAKDVKFAGAAMLTAFSSLIHDSPREVTVEELEKRKTEPEVRAFLQLVGTEIGKTFFNDHDVWVRRVDKRLEVELSPVVIDDCRFPNEQEALVKHNFLFVRVVRPDYEKVLVETYRSRNPNMPKVQINDLVSKAVFHASEAHIDNLYADVTIHASNVEELYKAIEVELGDYIGNV